MAGFGGRTFYLDQINRMDIATLQQTALTLDANDPLAQYRQQFHIPKHGTAEQVYFCGNSLGLQPKTTRAALLEQLDDWSALGVEAHFRGHYPWMNVHESVRDDLATLVGAKSSEVVAMNSLTTNLHLMMVSFYRPSQERPAILIEAGSFPSDRYAVNRKLNFMVLIRNNV